MTAYIPLIDISCGYYIHLWRPNGIDTGRKLLQEWRINLHPIVFDYVNKGYENGFLFGYYTKYANKDADITCTISVTRSEYRKRCELSLFNVCM